MEKVKMYQSGKHKFKITTKNLEDYTPQLILNMYLVSPTYLNKNNK